MSGGERHLPPARDGWLATPLPADALHGLTLVPPVVRWSGTQYHGSRLLHVEQVAAQAMPGVVAVVQRTHFVGVLAVAPVHAQQALAALAPAWQAPASAVRARRAAEGADPAVYAWRLPGADTPAGARVAVWATAQGASVWLPSGPPDVPVMVCQELAVLLGLPVAAVRCSAWGDDALATPHPVSVVDAAAEAAVLSQACGRAVWVACRSQGASELALQRTVTDPAAGAGGAATGGSQDGSDTDLAIRIGVGRQGDDAGAIRRLAESAAVDPAFPRFQAQVPWAVRPSLARLLSQPQHARTVALATVGPTQAVTAPVDARPLVPASVADLNAAQVFAQESAWHEDALAHGQDPIAWRWRHLPEGRAQALARQVVEHAGESITADAATVQDEPGRDGRLIGRGFATAHVRQDAEQGGPQDVWSAWVADVAIDPASGQIEVTRVIAGHDSRDLRQAQPAGVRVGVLTQDAELLASARRLLGKAPAFDDWRAARAPAAGDNTTDAAPEVALTQRSTAVDPAPARDGPLAHGSLGGAGVVTLPAAAAIANAIHAATGVRLREVPFDAAQLRLALAQGQGGGARSGWRRGLGWLAAGVAGIAGLATMAWPAKPALPLTAGPDVSLYSAQAIERGRLVAAAGDCIACHTAPGGAPNAGGLALETPFGTIYSTNITPDNDTGIGRWSYAAFERAMRHGIHQDGSQLYPAFPYTAFAKLSEGDVQALYGYLMSQPAVAAEVPKTRLAFPYSLRPAVAGWNALFHDPTPFAADPERSIEWNRGAYLVQGAGHCAACHSPRNALGAEKSGIYFLASGEAEGWQAPALNALASAPRPWSRDDLFQYLRTGYSAQHGVAAGPMAPVIHGLSALPDSDLQAISTYLFALPGATADAAVPSAPPATAAPAPTPAPTPVQPVPAPVVPAPAVTAPTVGDALPVFSTHVNGERIYQNACAVCHEAGSGPTLFGAKPLLADNTNLHAASPDNLIHLILHGIPTPADDALGFMPGFRDSLDDRQIADLLGYLRARFAPQAPAWPRDEGRVARWRAVAPAHAMSSPPASHLPGP